MQMKLSRREEAAFFAVGEPRSEPDYAAELSRLRETMTPAQDRALMALLEAFSALVRHERRWYFHKGYLAAKKETTR